jgi:prepilin-type N-terminal cleavage/methylation domain-containing protein
MAMMGCNLARRNGFTMLEVLLSVLIVVVTATVYLMWQKTSWTQTTYTNRRMAASQVMEKQIEWRRMIIAQNPIANFAAFKALTETTMVETSPNPDVTVVWDIFDDLRAPNGDPVTGAVRVHLVARWGGVKADSLSLWTNITKNF